METEKISIIVPVYNTDKYLKKCLDSLINQTYNNLEIICIDDGSLDQSPEILDAYARQDKRIKVIHQQNGGAAKARNTGLDAATGAWITFTDSDDWMEPDLYEKLLSFGHEYPADILSFGYYIDYSDKETEAINLHPVPLGTQNMREFLYYIYCRDDYKGVTSYIWNKLFRASIINCAEENMKIRFDESLGSLGEDIDWASRCYLRAETIAYLPNAFYHHRERDDSVFHSLDQRLETLQHIQAYEKIIALYEKNNIDKRTINYIKRLYVYHLGILIEQARKADRIEKMGILKNKAIPYLDIYIQTNIDHPEWIKWAKGLFDE